MSDKQDNYVNKPPTSIPPVRRKIDYSHFNDTADTQTDLWKEYGMDMYYQYKKGAMLAKKTELDAESYELILDALIQCVFQSMRDRIEQDIQNIEERQLALVKISSMEHLFSASIGALETIDFKLARNSVLPILHGYVNECVSKIATEYESKRKY